MRGEGPLPTAPGRRVATGHLRVDAARAVSKLREYQLIERRLWILEALRGAVGAGAKQIWVDADADDVWLAWEGEPPELAILGALLDELVSPTANAERRWARLLATAVNTALGEGTRWVDVWHLDGDQAAAFRYAPALLEERDHDDQALRPVPRTGERPDAPTVPERGVLVQVRRRFGMDVVGRWLSRGAAPELSLLDQVGAARRSRVPLVVRGEAAPGDADVLVSVELGERGRMVLLRPEDRGPQPFLCHWMELGVPLAVSPALVHAPERHTVPAALLYDADRLPTNAARSTVRVEDEGLAFVVAKVRSEGLRALTEASAAAYRETHERLVAAGQDPTEDERHEALRSAILRWLASHIGGAHWRTSLGTHPEHLDPFVGLPLVRTAIGRWVELSAIEVGPALRAREPEEPDLEPWLGRVLWLPPDDPSADLYGGQPLPARPRELLREAHRALAARRAWLQHQQRPPTIPLEPGQWLSVRFGRGVPRGRSALPLKQVSRRLTGEVCLLDPAGVPPSHQGIGQVTLLLEGRPLAQFRVASGVPFEAVVESPKLEPTPDYRNVEMNGEAEAAVRAAELFALRAVELLLGKLEPNPRPLLESARVRAPVRAEAHLGSLRRAVRRAAEMLGLDRKQVLSQLRGPFREAPIFELVEDEQRRRLSLKQLVHRFEREEAIVFLRSPLEPPAARPAVLDSDTVWILDRRFGDKPVFQYDAAMGSRRPKMDEGSIVSAVRRPDWPMLMIDLGDVRGAIALGGHQSTLYRLHRGVRIDQVRFQPAFGPCSVAMDDDRIIPTERWDGVALQPDVAETLGRFEQAIFRALVDALAGDEVGGLRMSGDLWKMVHVHDAILRAATHDAALDQRRRERLEKLPLLATIGGERISLDELARREEIAWLASHEAHLDGLPSDLLRADAHRAETLAQLTGLPARHATRELEQAHAERRRRANLTSHRRQAKRPLPTPGELEVPLESDLVRGLGRVGRVEGAWMDVEVRIEARPFARIRAAGPPLEAVVEVPVEWADGDFERLGEGAEEAIVKVVRGSAGPLLERIAERSPRLLHDSVDWAAVLDDWLDESFLRQDQDSRRVRKALMKAPAYPAAQGGFASVADAATEKWVRVCEPLGEWLGPAEGEGPHRLDAPTLAIEEPHRSRVERLALGKKLTDFSRAMKRLQDERRVARGLVERPSLRHVPAALKAPIDELSPAGRQWRIGEIGLVPPNQHSSLELYWRGQHVRTVPLTIEPPVQVAIEDSALAEESGALPAALWAHLGRLVAALLKERIVPHADELPRWVATSIRRGFLLAGSLDRAEVETLPLFETTANRMVSLVELEEQVNEHRVVWVTTAEAYLQRNLVPLDPTRLAIRATPIEHEALSSHVPTLLAMDELRLDEEARRNLAKPALQELVLPARWKPHFLAEGTIRRRALQGRIALLEGPAPEDAAGIAVHRDMRPLGMMPSPAGWPVAAIIDDPRLDPDRVHGAPLQNRQWQRVVTAIRKARAELWKELVPTAPDEALTSIEVKSDEPGACVRGRLWLTPVRHGGRVRVWLDRTASTMAYGPSRAALPMRGELWVHVPERRRRRQVAEAALEEGFRRLCHRIEGRALKGDDEAYAVLLLAALAVGREAGKELRAAPIPGLGCSLGELVEAKGAGLGEVRDLLPAEPLGEAPEPIAAVLRRELPRWVLRPKRQAPAVEPARVETASADAKRSGKTKPRRSGKRPKKAKPARKPHALDPLAQALAQGLRHSGAGCRVMVVPRRKRGLLRYDTKEGVMELSGAHPQLVALQAARLSNDPNADRALRLLVAHAVGVLDRALASVTAATQRGVTRALLGEKPRR